MSGKIKGTVERYSSGWDGNGFILGDDGERYFVDATMIRQGSRPIDWIQPLNRGQRVSFMPCTNKEVGGKLIEMKVAGEVEVED